MHRGAMEDGKNREDQQGRTKRDTQEHGRFAFGRWPGG
jgi:hypothetical protein